MWTAEKHMKTRSWLLSPQGNANETMSYSIPGDVPKIQPTALTPGPVWATDKPHAAGGSAAP